MTKQAHIQQQNVGDAVRLAWSVAFNAEAAASKPTDAVAAIAARAHARLVAQADATLASVQQNFPA